MSDYRTAGEGLSKVFIGEILTIFSIIPLLGWIAAIVGTVLQLVGLNQAGRAAEGYRTAFQMSIAVLVLSVLGVFLPFMSLISSLVSLGVLYCVCTTTADLLDGFDTETAQRGRTVWKICLGCTIASVVCGLLALVPLINILAAVALVISGIIALVGSILYLIFLYRASDSLRNT